MPSEAADAYALAYLPRRRLAICDRRNSPSYFVSRYPRRLPGRIGTLDVTCVRSADATRFDFDQRFARFRRGDRTLHQLQSPRGRHLHGAVGLLHVASLVALSRTALSPRIAASTAPAT